MIPVRNLYYMLIYAWDALEASDEEPLDPEEVLELLARVLVSGTTVLLRRGLDRCYIERAEVMAGIRGRLDIETSLKRALFPQALAACRFDELSHDVPHNRVIRATLYQLHAYMTNMAASDRFAGPVEGMLLYPETEGPVQLDYRIHGRRLRVSTVNLDQPWQGIRDELLELVA